MLVFYFFAAIVIWLGVLSLLSGFRFADYVRRELQKTLPDFRPFATVFVPCRGDEAGLRENIRALCEQDYPNYEIIFVADREDDPALGVVKAVMAGRSIQHLARIVVAGEAVESGQKVHNLRVAVTAADSASVIFVFVDTDARPGNHWLRSLIAPLQDAELGATTGYRWFVPNSSNVASQLRSVWNASIASALGENVKQNFCWGGSTAIRRSTFEKLQVRERWQGTVSDDFTLTRVLQEAKLPIQFVPACIVASFGDCAFPELLEFTNRQLKITRVYAAHLWKPLLIGSLLFCAVFFGGIAVVVERAIRGLGLVLPFLLLLAIYALGAAKAYVRFRAIQLALGNHQRQPAGSLPAHLILWPFASLLYLCNALTAAFSQTINWRGITYELKSATEAVIIAREP